MKYSLVSLLVVASVAGSAAADVQVFTSGGSDAQVTQSVNDFRGALGAQNANSPGEFAGGRREINWDGVGDAFASSGALPGNFFNQNFAPRARGSEFGTPGSHLEVSANLINPSGALKDFGNIDPSYLGLFREFSAQRLFTPVGSNVTDVRFFVAGTSTPALVSGFGAVFSDVDTENSTRLRFYGPNGRLVQDAFVPASAAGNEGYSFFGLKFTGSQRIARVEIITGTAALGAGILEDLGAGRDLVVMDDFIYGEPQNLVPAPGGAAIGLGAVGALAMRRRRA